MLCYVIAVSKLNITQLKLLVSGD